MALFLKKVLILYYLITKLDLNANSNKQSMQVNNLKQGQYQNSIPLFNQNQQNTANQKDLAAIKKHPNAQEKNVNHPLKPQNNPNAFSPSNTQNYTNFPSVSLNNQEQIQQAAAPDDEDEENYEMEFLERYHGKAAKNVRLVKQDFTDDGKVIKYFENEKKEIIFPSGVKKETFPDGYQITYFNNKDIKQIYPDGKEVYLFSENQTLQFKFADGLQVFKFQDGQIEKNFPDGIKHIIYKDGTVKYIYPDQSDETIFPDGTLQKTDVNGVITIDYVDQIRVKLFLLILLN